MISKKSPRTDDTVCRVMIAANREKVHNSGAPSAVWSGEGNNLPALGPLYTAAEFFPPVSKPIRHLVIVTAHLAVQIGPANGLGKIGLPEFEHH